MVLGAGGLALELAAMVTGRAVVQVSEPGIFVPTRLFPGLAVLHRHGVDYVRRVDRVDRLDPEIDAVVRHIASEAAVFPSNGSGKRDSRSSDQRVSVQTEALSLTAAECATLLGVTTRRIGQLSTALGGRKQAGRWLFDAETVRRYAETRAR